MATNKLTHIEKDKVILELREQLDLDILEREASAKSMSTAGELIRQQTILIDKAKESIIALRETLWLIRGFNWIFTALLGISVGINIYLILYR